MPDPGGEPGSANFVGLSCTSSTACLAVGSFYPTSGGETAPLAERLSGGRWSIEAVGPAAVMGGLFGISCRWRVNCTAVGDVTTTGGQVARAVVWNGVTWSTRFTPDQSVPAAAALNAVSCASTVSCSAVGQYTALGGGHRPLAVGWDGSRWSLERTPALAGISDAELDGVACTAPAACIAVGSGPGGPLTERWNGVSWTIMPQPGLPAGSVPGGGSLTAVSCTSVVACTAVGRVMVGSGSAPGVAPLAERWNGVAWAVESVPNPGAGFNQLSGVSCASAVACTAVGTFTSGGRALITQPLSMGWNGVVWNMQAAGSPTGSGALSGVSCVSASACTAVGREDSSYGQPPPLAEAWNGMRWSVEAVPGPTPPYPISGSLPGLDGVSCVAVVACAAVGASQTIGTLFDRPLAFIWNGVAWGAQTLPGVAGATTADLNGVSCVPAGVCETVGLAVVRSTGGPPVSRSIAYRLSG